MNLDDIFAMWKKDSQIDENNLDQATLENAKLHSKYLELHSNAKLQVKRKELASRSYSKTSGYGIMER